MHRLLTDPPNSQARMVNRLSLPLKYRIAVIVFALEAMMLGAVLWQTLNVSTESLHRYADAQSGTVLRLITLTARSALLSKDYGALEDHLSQIVMEPEYSGVLVTDAQGIVVAGTEPELAGRRLIRLPERPQAEWRSRVVGIHSESLGAVHVQLSAAPVFALIRNVRLRGLLVGLAGMVAILVVGVVATQLLTRRLNRLEMAARKLAAGDYSVRADMSGRDDVAALGAAMDALAERVEHELGAREEAVAALRESEALLRLMTDSVPALLSYIDRDGIVRLSNGTHASWMNREREEVEGQSVRELMPPEAVATIEPYISVVLAGKRVAFQSTLLYPDGVVRELSSVYVPDLASDGTVRGFSSIAEDVTERNRQARLIATSAARLRLLTDAVPVAITYLDAALRYQFTNHEYANWLGKPPEELQGRTPRELLAPETYGRMEPALLRALAGERMDFERRVIYPDGRERDVHVVYVPDQADDGTVRGISAMVEDRTAHNQALRALRESEFRLRLFIDSAPLLISYVDRDIRFGLVNQSLAEWMDSTPAEMVGRHVSEVLSAESFAALKPKIEQAIAGQPVELEMPVTYPSGRFREMRMIYVPHRGEDGAVLGYFAIAEDISNRKRAERALSESEARYRTVISNAPVIIWAIDPQGICTLSEGKGLEALGMEPGEAVGLPIFDDSSDDPVFIEATQRALRGERVSIVRELGGVIFEVSYNPVYDEGGQVSGTIGVATDVTDRERAVAALRESEVRFRVVAENTPVPVIVTDPETSTHLYDNRAACEFFLGQPTGLEGQQGVRLWVDAAERADVVRHMEADGTAANYETRVWGLGGRIRWVVASSAGVQFNGRPAMLTSFHDVTERREAEERLRYHETLLQAIFDALPVWVTVKDRDLRYLMVNHASLQSTGLKAADYIGAHTRDLRLGTAEEMEAIEAFDRRVLERGERLTLQEFALTDSDGRVTYLDHYVVPFEVRPGGRSGIVTVSVDVSERRAAAEEIRRGQALLQAVFDVLPVWVFVKDRESRFLMANPEMARELGVPVQSLTGMAHESVPNGDQARRAAIRDKDLHVMSTGTRIMEDEPYIMPDGRLTTRTVIKAPLRDEHGAIVGLVGVAQDVTARKLAEERLRELNEQLEQRVHERTAELEAAQMELVRREKMATLGQLTATVSHELRNPLGTIQTSTYTLRERLEGTDTGVERILERIQRNVVRCDNIIRDLLDYSRHREPDLQPVTFDAWVRSLVAEQRVPEHVSVVLDLGLERRTVSIDTDYLRRAFINIFENAVQAVEGWTAPAEFRAQVTVTTALEGNVLRLTVTDNGPGMDPDVQAKIFEPLFSTKTYGVGLGLPTVRQIMRQNRGDIVVTSRHEGPQRGTVAELWLELPEHRAPPA